MTVSPRSLGSLLRLREADYELADGPDLRGWDVVLATDERVGTVDELMVDPSDGRLRYLEVCVTAKAAGRDRSRLVLIPLDTARVDVKDGVVVLSGMTRSALMQLPDCTGERCCDIYDADYRSELSNAYPPKRITQSAQTLRIRKRRQKLRDRVAALTKMGRSE